MTSTMMKSASLFLSVNVPPSTRRATGSFNGALPCMVIVVPGTSPISRILRPSSPLTFTEEIVPVWWTAIFLKFICAISDY